MKKIYNQPACLVVALGTMHMMAESLIISEGGDGKTIENSNEVLTKEITDVNIWDEEW